MGMRAVFGYQNGQDVYLTTVQWSTLIHRTLRYAISTRLSQQPTATFDQVAHDVFTAIVSVCHIGSVDALTKDERRQPFYSDAGIIFPFGGEGEALCITGRYCEEPVEHYRGEDVADLIRNHPHAQDGISAWHVEGSGQIEFWMDPEVRWGQGRAHEWETLTAENVHETPDWFQQMMAAA